MIHLEHTPDTIEVDGFVGLLAPEVDETFSHTPLIVAFRHWIILVTQEHGLFQWFSQSVLLVVLLFDEVEHELEHLVSAGGEEVSPLVVEDV